MTWSSSRKVFFNWGGVHVINKTQSENMARPLYFIITGYKSLFEGTNKRTAKQKNVWPIPHRKTKVTVKNGRVKLIKAPRFSTRTACAGKRNNHAYRPYFKGFQTSYNLVKALILSFSGVDKVIFLSEICLDREEN